MHATSLIAHCSCGLPLGLLCHVVGTLPLRLGCISLPSTTVTFAGSSFLFTFRPCFSSSSALRFLSSFNFWFFACNLSCLSLLLAPPPPALSCSVSKNSSQCRRGEGQQISRQLHIDLPCRGQAVVEVGVVIELQTRLHAFVAVKFEECIPFGLASVLLRPMAYRARLYLCKVSGYGFHCNGEREIA